MSLKKEVDFEVNLLPIISLLEVLICFLLLSTVWVQFGAQNLEYAYGKSSSKSKSSTVQTQIDKANNIHFYITSSNNRVLFKSKIKSKNNKPNYRRLNKIIAAKNRKKRIKTAIISPSSNTSYQDIIKVMDILKASSITDVGIGTI